MRITITTDYYWPHIGGGVEVVTRQVAERLAERGHQVSVLTLNTRKAKALELLNGVGVVRLPALETTRLVSLQSAVPRNPLGVWTALRWLKPDLVHVNGRFFATSVLSMLFKGRMPAVLTLHVAPVRMGRLVRLYERVVTPRLVRAATAVTAISPLAAQVCPQATVIPNGVDTQKFHPVQGKWEGFRVLYVGRLIRNKGPQRLLESVPLLHPAVRVMFVGDGPMRSQLEERAKALGVKDRVTFLGTRDDVDQILPYANLFVRPSDTGAGDLAVLEALACGVPVLASHASAGEFIEHGVNGYILRKNTPAEIASLINMAYCFPETLGPMAREARRTAEGFSWETSVDKYEQLFLEVVARSRRSKDRSPSLVGQQ